MFGEPADKFHGRGGNRSRRGSDTGSRGGWIWRGGQRQRRPAQYTRRRGGAFERSGDAGVKTQALVFNCVSGPADVLFNGPYDVEFPSASHTGTESCGDGADTAIAHNRSHGHEPEVFYQRVQEPLAQGAQHGYTGRTWLCRSICLQHICIVCHDRCAA